MEREPRIRPGHASRGIPPLLVGAQEAADQVGMGIKAWRRLVAAGDAPPPVRLARFDKQLWRVADIEKWVEGLGTAVTPMTAKEIADAATSHLVK